MQNGLIAVLFAMMALLLSAVLFLFVGQSREKQRRRRDRETTKRLVDSVESAFAETARAVEKNTAEMSARQDRLRDAIDARIDAMQSSNERRLEQMRRTVDENLRENLDRSFESVNDRLRDVHRGLGQMNALMGELSDVRRVLSGVKTRGVWGEVQLRSLLSEMLAPGQYIENAAIPADSTNRVEFAVRIGDGNETLLPIDAKFPMEDYLRFAEASENADAAAIRACGASLERALTEQAKKISEKYIRPPQTTDYAVMFLPVESLYAEAVRRAGLCEKLQTRYHVLTAGPNTLAALLTSLRVNYTTARLERRSGEVLDMLAGVRSSFAAYDEALDTLRKRLARTDEAAEALAAKSRALRKTLERAATEDEE